MGDHVCKTDPAEAAAQNAPDIENVVEADIQSALDASIEATIHGLTPGGTPPASVVGTKHIVSEQSAPVEEKIKIIEFKQ